MATFIQALIFVLWILAMVGSGVVALVQCFDGRPVIGVTAGVVAVLLTAGGITLMNRAADSAMHRCLDSGRAWAITGEHTEFIYNAALKMATPQTVTDYGCVARAQ